MKGFRLDGAGQPIVGQAGIVARRSLPDRRWPAAATPAFSRLACPLPCIEGFPVFDHLGHCGHAICV
ncbi:hypothetical protein D9X30_5110 [Cupriavidus sp. U2]|nr:hypothetical protein D9X30_5110 [Cupriavidus sp. U2]